MLGPHSGCITCGGEKIYKFNWPQVQYESKYNYNTTIKKANTPRPY